MDILPTEITPLILTWLKRFVNYTDDIYLFRAVNKEWDRFICQSTIELPVKFWYWLARKSHVNPGIFIPLSFINLTKMKLYEGYQIDLLTNNIKNFKQLHTVNIRSVQSWNLHNWSLIYSTGLPLIKSNCDTVVFGKLLSQNRGLIRYATMSETYHFVTHDMFGKKKSYESLLSEMTKLIKYPSQIAKVTLWIREFRQVTEICKMMSKEYSNVEVIKLSQNQNFDYDCGGYENIIGDIRELMEIFPKLKVFRTKDEFVERSALQQIHHFDRNTDNNILSTLIRVQRSSRLGICTHPVVLGISWDALYMFLRQNNLMNNAQWLGTIKDVEIIDIDYENTSKLAFIRDNILKVANGLSISLQFNENNLKQIPNVVQALDTLFRNYSFFKVTHMTLIFDHLRFSDIMSIMKNHSNVFFHNNCLRKIYLQINNPVEKSPKSNTIPSVVSKYYTVKRASKTAIEFYKK